MSVTASHSSEDESLMLVNHGGPQGISLSQTSFASDTFTESPPLVRTSTADVTTISQGIQQRPVPQERPVSRRAVTHDIQMLARNNQESFSSVTEVRSPTHMHSLGEEEEEEEALETLNGDKTAGQNSQSSKRRSRGMSSTKPPSLFRQADSAPSALDGHDRHESFQVDDFFVKAGDVQPDMEETRFTLVRMLKELLAYHTRTLADSQTASIFTLLLAPLLPETHPLPQAEFEATLNHYLDHLSSLNMSDDTMLLILSTHISHLISSGIQPLYAESILSNYHEQLLSLSLLNNAAYLRRLSYPTYPSVYEQGLKENQISLRCGGCKKPINNPRDKLFCESCSRKQKPCPICWCGISPFETTKKKKRKQAQSKAAAGHSEAKTSHSTGYGETQGTVEAARKGPVLYTTCLNCDHSAHAACLDIWHGSESAGIPAAGESEGICPTEGCDCFCIGGAKAARRADEQLKSQSRKKSIRDDETVVAESRAVGAVRRSLSGRARGSVESLR